MRLTIALAALLLLVPTLSAQEHAHLPEAGVAMVLHDGPDDGRAVVGVLSHFGFALLDSEGAPVVHNDARFTLRQDNVTLFSTTDTHEYDGLFSFDWRFAKPGRYHVTAESAEMVIGTFEGDVVLPVNETAPVISMAFAPAGPASNVVAATLSIDGPDGILRHTDALVEIRRAGTEFLVSRAHYHIHADPISFEMGFGAPGDYVAHVVASKSFATGAFEDVPAGYAAFPFSIGPLALPAVAPPVPAAPPVLSPRGAVSEGAGIQLHAMVDPQGQVGVGQPARLAALVVDATNRTPLAHVNFAFELTGPRGLVVRSDSLHEYDGTFEHMFVPDAPGTYTGLLTANVRAGNLSVPFRVDVVPNVVPLGGLGPIDYAVEGLDATQAGVPAILTFRATGPSGPAAHSEVDVTIFREGEAPLALFKLHAHGSGATSAEVTLPVEGAWRLRIDGLPTSPEPALYPSRTFDFDVAPAPAGAAEAATMPANDRVAVPDAGLVAAILGLALVTAWSRRSA